MRITILGGGNGAVAAAAHMTLNGHTVTLSNRSPKRLQFLRESPDVHIMGGALPDCTVQIKRVVDDPAEAIRDAEIVMVCVPTIAHAYYAEKIAHALREDQIVFLNPGHMGGGLQFSHYLRAFGYDGKMNVVETNSLTYITRMQSERTIGIFSVANHILVSSIPRDNPSVDRVLELYPALERVPTVLHTAMADANAVLHPPGMLLNAAHIERTNGGFTFYDEGTTPAVGALMEDLDRERLAVAKALGVTVEPIIDCMYRWGYTTREAFESGSCYQMLKQSEPNKTLKCESSLNSRYINEDVGYGLVPMSCIARAIGVATPIMDSLICLCGSINRKDYLHDGLTLEKMGLAGVKSVEDIWAVIDNL